MNRRAEAADRGQIIALWQRVFGDGEAVVAECLDVLAGAGNVYVSAEGETVNAILLAAPCSCGGRQGAYLYALATQPEHRGHGVMAGLLAHAEVECKRRGAAFLALVPAGESLFGYYRKLGFSDITLRWVLMNPAQVLHMAGEGGAFPAGPHVHEVRDTATLAGLREEFLPREAVRFAGAREALALRDVFAAGWRVLACGGGYLVFRANDADAARMDVAELCADNDDIAAVLLQTACHRGGFSKALITLPQNDGILGGVDAEKSGTYAAAQVKPLCVDMQTDGMYLRFALDEVFHKDYEPPA